VFNLQPCDSGLEVSFCGFLDRCSDVAAFAKLAREVRFSLEYRAEGGRLAYYYPDFVVRLEDGQHLLVETKGLADLDVPHKDERAARWAVDASVASGTRWTYLRVDEGPFRQHETSLRTAAELVDLVHARRREIALRGLEEPSAARGRTREQALALQRAMSERLRGVTGGDELLQSMRDDAGD
jgi:type III restriction enzyme